MTKKLCCLLVPHFLVAELRTVCWEIRRIDLVISSLFYPSIDGFEAALNESHGDLKRGGLVPHCSEWPSKVDARISIPLQARGGPAMDCAGVSNLRDSDFDRSTFERARIQKGAGE